MKPAHLLAALLLALAPTARAQITLDFADRKTSGLPKHPRPGNEYTLRITGINLNLYSVSIDARDTASPEAVTFPLFSTFAADGIGGLLGGIITGIAGPRAGDAAAVPDDSGASDGTEQPPCNGSGCQHDTPNPAAGEPLIRQRFRDEQRFLQDSLLPRLARTGEEVEEDYYLLDVMRLRARCEDAADTAQFAGSGRITPREVMCHFQSGRHDLAALRSDVTRRADSYHVFSGAYALADRVDFSTADTLLKRAYARLLAAIDTAMLTVTPAKASEACNALMILTRNERRTYESMPFRYVAGQKKLTVFITPIKPEAGLQSYAADVAFPAQRRFYFGVGTGLYVSGLYDEAYSTQPRRGASDTAVSYWLVDEEPSRSETGFATLLKAGAKLGGSMDWLGGHVSFGPGISVGSTVRPRLMGGLGLSAGRTHMLTLDAGVITGRVERLSKTLTMTDGYTEAPAQPTVSVGAGSWFVGLGYLFRL